LPRKVMTPTVVFVPGLRDHVGDHWQTLLEARLPGSKSVPRIGKDNLRLAAWIEAIDHTVGSVQGPVVLAAHSAGVIMVAHFALGPWRNVCGALLAVPPDLEAGLPAGYPSKESLVLGGWMPIPRVALPFPSILVGSSNDPLSSLESARSLARAWRSDWVSAGDVGHLNPAAGFGEWPLALELLGKLGVELPARSQAA
jgi:predicted alpha/beta hydrolase family esterase